MLTSEWMYEPVPIPAGQSWKTSAWMMFCTGLDAVAYASGTLISDSRIRLEEGSCRVLHRTVAGPLGPRSVRLGGNLTNRGVGEDVKFKCLTTIGKMVPTEE